MKCGKYVKIISAYIDMEAGIIEQHALREHLKTCTGCKKELASQYKLREMLLLSVQKQMTVNVLPNVMFRINSMKKPAAEPTVASKIANGFSSAVKKTGYFLSHNTKAVAVAAAVVLTITTVLISNTNKQLMATNTNQEINSYEQYVYQHVSLTDYETQSRSLSVESQK